MPGFIKIAVGDELQDAGGDVYEVVGVFPSRGLVVLADSSGVERTMIIEALIAEIESGALELLDDSDAGAKASRRDAIHHQTKSFPGAKA
ncbi:MAG: hypothetical protein ACYDCF_05115 [Burkholderiales bacterium]